VLAIWPLEASEPVPKHPEIGAEQEICDRREACPKPQQDVPSIYATGAPGRPTSRQLVETEMERRAETGEMITTSVAKEAAALADWLKCTHPRAPRLSTKTLQNTIAEKWRALGGLGIPKSIPKCIPKRNEGG
jgi:hypothetical protein